MKVVPITMITGFLGAGKSTLINRILKEKPNTKFGLIVNEFGDVNLESQILETTKEEVVELSNGCMCCVVRKDIVAAVQTLMDAGKTDAKKAVDYIIVEASGLSDPVPIAQTFLMNDLDGKVRLDAVLCLVDVENFEHNMEQFQIAYTQLQAADIVLLSKVDIAESSYLIKVKEFLKESAPNAAIVALDNEFHADQILDTSAFDHTELSELEVYDDSKHDDAHHQHHADPEDSQCDHEHCECKHADHEGHDQDHEHESHDCRSHKLADSPTDAKDPGHQSHECCGHCHHEEDHDHGDHHHPCACGHDHHDHSAHEHHHAHEHVDTIFFKSDKPLDFKKFSTFITTVPVSVIRAKGFVWFGKTAEHDLKYILQFVGARRQLQYKEWSQAETKQTAIVFIGKTLPKKQLLEGISSCVQEAAR